MSDLLDPVVSPVPLSFEWYWDKWYQACNELKLFFHLLFDKTKTEKTEKKECKIFYPSRRRSDYDDICQNSWMSGLCNFHLKRDSQEIMYQTHCPLAIHFGTPLSQSPDFSSDIKHNVCILVTLGLACCSFPRTQGFYKPEFLSHKMAQYMVYMYFPKMCLFSPVQRMDNGGLLNILDRTPNKTLSRSLIFSPWPNGSSCTPWRGLKHPRTLTSSTV